MIKQTMKIFFVHFGGEDKSAQERSRVIPRPLGSHVR